MSGTRAISTTSRRELSSSFFFSLQGKAPKEIHTILTETLACFLPGRAKVLSAPLYIPYVYTAATRIGHFTWPSLDSNSKHAKELIFSKRPILYKEWLFCLILISY